MTSPPDDPVELASALIDGDLPEEDAARASADPEVMARAAELRDLRARLRDVPPAPDLSREAAIGAALGAADGGAAGGTRRDRRPWLVAAAAAVLAVLGAGLVAQFVGDEPDTLASREATEEPDAEEPAGPAPLDDGADSGAATEGAAPDVAAPDLPYLGAAPDGDGLVSLVRGWAGDRRAAPETPGTEARAQIPGCPAHSPAGDLARGRSELAATASLAGDPVWVHVYPAAGDRVRLVATDGACVDVVDETVRLSP